VVSESPPESSSHSSSSLGVSVVGEVPDAARSSNDELAKSIDESSYPQESKDLIPEDVSCLIAPLDLSGELKRGVSGNWGSHREDIGSRIEPDCEPDHKKDP
jgi:hypothetical protein